MSQPFPPATLTLPAGSPTPFTLHSQLGGDAGGLDSAFIAGLRWPQGARPVLALHGWLDNAASFNALAPLLADSDVLALDLPGHGLSSHRGLQGTYNIWDDLPDILRAADAAGFAKFHLVGHSRGAIIAALLAAALPERVLSLTMLDALRPPPAPLDETFEQLGRFARAYIKPPIVGGGARYESLERALEVRCRVAKMSEQAARPIVERGLREVDGVWQWRADPRLHLPSAFKLSAQHNQLLLERVRELPHRLILAQQGVGASVLKSELNGLKLNWAQRPGSHHFHLEPGVEGIAADILAFWDSLAQMDVPSATE